MSSYNYYFTPGDIVRISVPRLKNAVFRILKIKSTKEGDEIKGICIHSVTDPDLELNDILVFTLKNNDYTYGINKISVFPVVFSFSINGKLFQRNTRMSLFHQSALIKYIKETAKKLQAFTTEDGNYPYNGAIKLLYRNMANGTLKYYSDNLFVPYQTLVQEKTYYVYFKMFTKNMEETDETIYILSHKENKTLRFFTAYEKEPSSEARYSLVWRNTRGEELPNGVYSPIRSTAKAKDNLESRTLVRTTIMGIKQYFHVPIVVKHNKEEERYYRLVEAYDLPMDRLYQNKINVKTSWLTNVFQKDDGIMKWVLRWLKPKQKGLEMIQPSYYGNGKGTLKQIYMSGYKKIDLTQFEFVYTVGSTIYLNFQEYDPQELFLLPTVGESRLIVDGVDRSNFDIVLNEPVKNLFWRTSSVIEGSVTWQWIVDNIKRLSIVYSDNDTNYFHEIENAESTLQWVTPFDETFLSWSVEKWLEINNFETEDVYNVIVEMNEESPQTVVGNMYVTVNDTPEAIQQYQFTLPSTYKSLRVYPSDVFPQKKSNDTGPFQNEMQMAIRLRGLVREYVYPPFQFTFSMDTVFDELKQFATAQLEEFRKGNSIFNWTRGGKYTLPLKNKDYVITRKYDEKNANNKIVEVGYLTVTASIVRKYVTEYNKNNPNLEESTVYRVIKDLQKFWKHEDILCDRIDITLGNKAPVTIYQSFDDQRGRAIRPEYAIRNAFYTGNLIRTPKLLQLYPGNLSVEVFLKYADVSLLRRSREFQLTMDYQSYYTPKNVYRNGVLQNKLTYRVASNTFVKILARMSKLNKYLKRNNIPSMYEPEFEVSNGRYVVKEREKDFVNVGLLGCLDIATKDYQDRMKRKRSADGQPFETYECCVCRESGANCYLSNCKQHYYHYTCLYDKMVKDLKTRSEYKNPEEQFIFVNIDAPLMANAKSVNAHPDDFTKVKTVRELLIERLKRKDVDWNFIENLVYENDNGLKMVNTNLKCDSCRFSICPNYTVYEMIDRQNANIVSMPSWDPCLGDKVSWLENYKSEYLICALSPYYGYDEGMRGALEVVNHSSYWKAYHAQPKLFNVPKQIQTYKLYNNRFIVSFPDILNMDVSLDVSLLLDIFRIVKKECNNTMRVIIEKIQTLKQKQLDEVKNLGKCWVFDVMGLSDVVKIENENATINDLIYALQKTPRFKDSLMNRICNMSLGGKEIYKYGSENKKLLDIISPFGEFKSFWPSPKVRIRLLCQKMLPQMQNDIQRIKLNLCTGLKQFTFDNGFFVDVARNDQASILALKSKIDQMPWSKDFNWNERNMVIFCKLLGQGTVQLRGFDGTWDEFINGVNVETVSDELLEDAQLAGGEDGTKQYVNLYLQTVIIPDYLLQKYGDLTSGNWNQLSLSTKQDLPVELTYNGTTYPVLINLECLRKRDDASVLAKTIDKNAKAIVAEYSNLEDGSHEESIGIWMNDLYKNRYWITGDFEEEIAFERFQTPLIFNNLVSKKDMLYSGININRTRSEKQTTFFSKLSKKYNYRTLYNDDDYYLGGKLSGGWADPTDMFKKHPDDVLISLELAKNKEERDKIAYEQIFKNMFVSRKKVPKPTLYRVRLKVYTMTEYIYPNIEMVLVNVNKTFNKFEKQQALSAAKALKAMTSSQQSEEELQKQAMTYDWGTRMTNSNEGHILRLNAEVEKKENWNKYFKTMAQNIINATSVEEMSYDNVEEITFNIDDAFRTQIGDKMAYEIDYVGAGVKFGADSYKLIHGNDSMIEMFFNVHENLMYTEGEVENLRPDEKVFVFVRGNFEFTGAIQRMQAATESDVDDLAVSTLSSLDEVDSLNFNKLCF